VMVSHRALVAMARGTHPVTRVGPTDRVSGITPLHFAFSVLDIFGSALGGACLVLVSAEDAYLGPALARVIRDEEITVLLGAPSVLRMVMQAVSVPDPFPSLRQVWFGGEAFPPKDVRELRRLVPRAELINVYGGSETLARTSYLVEEIPGDDERIPLGIPFDNMQAIVVRPDGMPAGPGEDGELFMRGAQLMSGYWREPEKTASTLVPNPLAPDSPGVVCKTGDIVRVREDGNIVHVGRIDDQVKSRGVRVELGEIDHVLASHPDVVEGAAVAIPDEIWGTLIAACVIVRKGSGLTAIELKRHVAERLPLSMVPSRVEFLDELPHGSTGKIDRKRLTELATTQLVAAEVAGER
jgi:acyl-coenzyme A synthetase/AMP-(fatty) acid ligase